MNMDAFIKSGKQQGFCFIFKNMDHNTCLTIFISVNIFPVNYVVVWYFG